MHCRPLLGSRCGDIRFEMTTLEHFLEACSACEIHTVIHEWRDLLELRAALMKDDRRKTKGTGKKLRLDFERFGLLRGDRLEPSRDFWDYGELHRLTEVPEEGLKLVFWRPSAETRCTHRNPLLDGELGIVPALYLGDVLHVLYQGVFQHWSAYAFNDMAKSNVFRAPPTADTRAHTLSVFKSRLNDWYTANPMWQPTRIQDITLKMVGKQTKPKFHVKASECKHSLLFFYDLLRTDEVRLRLRLADWWVASAKEIVDHIRVMDVNPWRMPRDAAQERLHHTE